MERRRFFGQDTNGNIDIYGALEVGGRTSKLPAQLILHVKLAVVAGTVSDCEGYHGWRGPFPVSPLVLPM